MEHKKLDGSSSRYQQCPKIEDMGQTPRGKVSADEFNYVVEAIQQEQSNVDLIDGSSVKAIRQGERVFYPDQDGVVNIISSSATLTIYSQSGWNVNSYSGQTKLKFAFVVNDGNGVTGEGVTFKFYRASDDIPLLTQHFNSSSVEVVPVDADYVEVDLTPYISSDIVNYRIVVDADSTDVYGTHAINITATTISVTLNERITSWTAPRAFFVSENDVVSMRFNANYAITGSKSKYFYIRIYVGADVDDSNPANYYEYRSENPITGNTSLNLNLNLSSSAVPAGVRHHGVHAIKAWLETIEDEGVESFISDYAINRFMFINTDDYFGSASYRHNYLVLQSVTPQMQNYISSNVCHFTVFVPLVSGETVVQDTSASVDIVFKITDRNNTVVYADIAQSLISGSDTILNTGVEIEYTGEGIAPLSYETWLRAFENNSYDIMNGSGIDYPPITVLNDVQLAPTAGAEFVLNPKMHNNTSDPSDWQKIINDGKNARPVVASTWSNFRGGNIDGWLVDDDNIKILRIIAGESINITGLKPFIVFDPASQASNRAMTLDIDLNIKNVTDSNTPVIQIGDEISGKFIGIKMNAIKGWVLKRNWTKLDNLDFQWQEDNRFHISFNLYNNLEVSVDGFTRYVNLVRVMINGVINREIFYSTDISIDEQTGEVIADFLTDSTLRIGCPNADIDIYSIRWYKGSNLSSREVLQNYIASLTTTEEKLAVHDRNDIVETEASSPIVNQISLTKVKARSKNALIWHGPEPCLGMTDQGYPGVDSASGWWEIWVYNPDGTLDDLHSGTLCQYGKVKATRQGTTANTYFFSNLQTKIDSGGEVWVALADLDSRFITYVEHEATESAEASVTLTGGNLNKTYSYSDDSSASKYNPETHEVKIPDGWRGFDGKYRGNGWIVKDGTPMATKLVNKINYASCMQSHIGGGVLAYNDLHTRVVGPNSMQSTNPLCRVAKCVTPFLFFIQKSDTDPVLYRGACTFGSGKMDNNTWGYSKSATPKFLMIEGATNDAPLTDMRVPWDHEVRELMENDDGEYIVTPGTVIPDGELTGYCYPVRVSGNVEYQVNIDLDKAKLDDIGRPRSDVFNFMKDTWNFLYRHSVNIKPFAGTYSEFLQVTHTIRDRSYKFWIVNDQGSRHRMLRFDFKEEQWVNAGFYDENQAAYKELDLAATVDPTNPAAADAEILNGHVNWSSTDIWEINSQIIAAYAAHAKANMHLYFKTKSLLFHYAFVNYFIAGTDNCSKNTYYVIDPNFTYTEGGVTYENVMRFELHQDDVDTTFMTDNSGNQTKPYYLDRIHPFASDKFSPSYGLVQRSNQEAAADDPSIEGILYEGYDNVLFNLCEAMYSKEDQTDEIKETMRNIFTAMHDLVDDSLYNRSVWGFMEQYYFYIQRYFPEIAWSEQARIRYEFPAALGFVSSRGAEPITQSIGDQLQSEIQYMKNRIVMAASYAGYGEFINDTNHAIGIPGLSALLGAQAYFSEVGDLKFNLKAFQYIYPTFYNKSFNENGTLYSYHRLSPNDETPFYKSFAESGNDNGAGLLCANFYREVGNLGDNNWSQTLTVNGKRLTKLIVNPSSQPPIFHGNSQESKGLVIGTDSSAAKNLDIVDLTGCTRTQPTGVKNLTRATQIILKDTLFTDYTDLPLNGDVQLLDLRGCNMVNTVINNSSSLTTLKISYLCKNLTINNCPNLSSLIIENEVGRVSQLENITVNGTDLTSILLPSGVKSVNISNCQSLVSIADISASGIYSDLQSLVIGQGCDALGTKVIIDAIYRDQPTIVDRVITTLQIESIAWVDANSITPAVYNMILDIPNVLLNGTINLFEEVSGYAMNFTMKRKSLAKFGAIDDPSNHLYVTYRIFTLQWNMVITGPLYIRETGTFEFQVNSANIRANNFTSLVWSLDKSGLPSEDMCNIDQNGNLVVTALADGSHCDVKCTADLIGGAVNIGSRTTYIYNRRAAVGDYVYADGEYSDVLDSGKTVIGICFYVDYTDEQNPDRRMVAVANTGSSPRWGLYPNASYGPYPLTLETIPTSEIHDIPTIQNITSAGASYATDDNMIDSETGDFKVYATNTALGDIQRVTTAAEIQATEFVPAGTVMPVGRCKTLQIIEHRNKILQDPALSSYGLSIPQAEFNKTEEVRLGELRSAIVAYATASGAVNATYWDEFYYPAASYCYAYQPTVAEGEVLAEKFKAHNWYLPSAGELARLYWYHSKGYTVGVANAIFANAYAAGKFTQMSGSSYHWSSTEYSSNSAWYVYFSSADVYTISKYNQLVVRAVAAF